MVAPATKRDAFPTPARAVIWFYTNSRLLSIHRRPTATLAPKGETTHYDLCVALLLQIMFAVHARGASNLSPLRTFGPAGRQPSRPTGRVHNANKKKLPCGSRSMEINVYSWMPVPVMPSILLPVFLLLLQLRFQPAVLSLFILPP